MYDKNKIIGFCAVRPFPHPKNKNIRRCSRLVILPDYQGIGLGVNFLSSIASLYKGKGYDFRIVTTLKNFSRSLMKSGKFILKNCGVSAPFSSTSSLGRTANATRRKVKVCSFKYCGVSHG